MPMASNCSDGFFGGFGSVDLLAEFFHPHPLGDAGLAEGDVSYHLQIAGIVLFVSRGNLQHDLLICLGFRERLAESVFVIGEIPRADAVGDAFRISEAAEIVAEKNRQIAFRQRHAAAEHAAPAKHARQRRLVAFAGGHQNRAFGLGEDVAFHQTPSGNDLLFREIGLHQPAAVEARGFAFARHADLDVKLVLFADQGRQISPDNHEGRVGRGENLVGVSDVSAFHFIEHHLAVMRGRGIAAGAVQSGDQPHALQRDEV